MNNIQNLRVARGLSQAALAAKLDVDATTISKWETGNAFPTTKTLLKLADLFQCTTDEILGREPRAI